MHFPVILHAFGLTLPIHPVAEAIAYLVGIIWYVINRLRASHYGLTIQKNVWLLVFMFFGSLVGSRLLAWAQNPDLAISLLASHFHWMLLRGGQEVVGGLTGGWLAVEVGKKILRIRGSTGDPMVLPIMLGMMIGRVGCFFTGLADGTCGSPTNLPWAVNFGDGIPRHPTQLYDILFLFLLGLVLVGLGRNRIPGVRFRLFMGAYTGYRFLIDFLKPAHWTCLGLTAIQWLCLPVFGYCAYWLLARLSVPAKNAAALTLEAAG